MYIIKILNNKIATEMHGYKSKLLSGSISKGINSINSFTCTISPQNTAFNKLNEFTTLIEIYNTSRKRYEFNGRLLYSNPSMSEDGKIIKEVTFESDMGFLCDSMQKLVSQRSWTVNELLKHIIDVHNSQVEDYKQIKIGDVTVTDPNGILNCGIQRKNSFEVLKETLLAILGGEIQLRKINNEIYLDYHPQIGETKTTEIALSKNMKAITKEKNPSEYITRLIPLGSKISVDETITDEEGNTSTQTSETEERVEITSVNNGLNYIDDETGIKQYGIHVGYVEFDDIAEPSLLLSKAQQWLIENNKLKVKYSINALDLSLLGYDIDDFEVGNFYPIKNPLLAIDDTARVIKKTINVCEEVKSTIEVGENLKTLQDLVIENQKSSIQVQNEIIEIKNNYVPNKALTDNSSKMTSLIEQGIASILLTVAETYTTTEANAEYEEMIRTQLSILQDEISLKFTTTESQITNVDGDLQTKFEELYEYIRFSGGKITLGSSNSSITLEIENDNISFKKDGFQFGSWDGENFHTGNIIVDVNERAQFGNFAFVPRSDGSLDFLKVGD